VNKKAKRRSYSEKTRYGTAKTQKIKLMGQIFDDMKDITRKAQ